MDRLLNLTRGQDAAITRLEVTGGSVCPEIWISSDQEWERMQASIASCTSIQGNLVIEGLNIATLGDAFRNLVCEGPLLLLALLAHPTYPVPHMHHGDRPRGAL